MTVGDRSRGETGSTSRGCVHDHGSSGNEIEGGSSSDETDYILVVGSGFG